jgi:hypothetical protein
MNLGEINKGVPNTQDDDGDHAFFTSDRQNMRPLGKLQPQGRLLLPLDRTT